MTDVANSSVALSAAASSRRVIVHSPQQNYPSGIAALLGTVWTHCDLIWQMARREVVGRYRGSVLGLLWSFFHPLAMLGVYTFAFSYVLRVDIPHFALYAFSGLILVSFFNEVVTRAPSFILQNSNYVKKVIFPLEAFPYVYLLAAFIHAALMLIVLVGALLVVHHSISPLALLAPLILLPMAFMMLGLAWFLSALGVFLRDVAQTIGIITLMLMYLSPVFYKLEHIQEKNAAAAILVRFNPLTIPLVNFRRVLLERQWPEWNWLGGYFAASVLIAWVGFVFFQRSRRGFADVL